MKCVCGDPDVVPGLRIGMTCDPVEELQQWVKDAIKLSTSKDEDMGFTIIADPWSPESRTP